MSVFITLLASILLLLLLAVFIIWLPAAIIFNVRAGTAYREKLAGKIEKMRLGKMLAALGVDINAYISNERGVDIHDHVARCNQCSNTRECDERIAQGDVAADDIAFCNNEQSLQKLTRSPD
ncbi:MAG: DUF6455 family protein [Gammaproteobacteria bacterium]|nr:DUF6455 family protein [Gammaproteobacteria bacterium]